MPIGVDESFFDLQLEIYRVIAVGDSGILMRVNN